MTQDLGVEDMKRAVHILSIGTIKGSSVSFLERQAWQIVPKYQTVAGLLLNMLLLKTPLGLDTNHKYLTLPVDQ